MRIITYFITLHHVISFISLIFHFTSSQVQIHIFCTKNSCLVHKQTQIQNWTVKDYHISMSLCPRIIIHCSLLAHLPQGSTFSRCFSAHPGCKECLNAGWNQSGHSPPISPINKAFPFAKLASAGFLFLQTKI